MRQALQTQEGKPGSIASDAGLGLAALWLDQHGTVGPQWAAKIPLFRTAEIESPRGSRRWTGLPEGGGEIGETPGNRPINLNNFVFAFPLDMVLD